MGRCIAFDKVTARAISQRLHLLAICNPEANPLQLALESNAATSLLVVPSESSNRVLLVRFQRQKAAPAHPQPPSSDPVGFEAAGFLGLSDQPVYQAEPQPQKKWWQKALE